MLSLKAFLDKLAGPDHPFVKGAPVEEVNEKKDGREKAAVPEAASNEAKLNKYLRMNTN